MYENPQAICLNPAQAVPKGSSYRSVGDFKAVNEQSEPVAAPPMILEEQALAFAGAALFMTVDQNQGYWQMTLAANSQELFTFVTHKGLYTPTRMPQGVTNATSYFQGALERTLGDLVRRVCLVYVDGVVICRHLGMKRLGVDGSLLVGSEETGEGWPVCGCSQS